MTLDEIKALPLSEKLRLMEILWDDLRERFEKAELSSELKAVLDERRVRAGRAEFPLLDWDMAKGLIGR